MNSISPDSKAIVINSRSSSEAHLKLAGAFLTFLAGPGHGPHDAFYKGRRAVIEFFKLMDEEESNYVKKEPGDYKAVDIGKKTIVHLRSVHLIQPRDKAKIDTWVASMDEIQVEAFKEFVAESLELLNIMAREGSSLRAFLLDGHEISDWTDAMRFCTYKQFRHP